MCVTINIRNLMVSIPVEIHRYRLQAVVQHRLLAHRLSTDLTCNRSVQRLKPIEKHLIKSFDLKIR